jgi:hypothetical protein
MAVDIGPVGLGHLGFNGAVATNLGRMVNSKPPRRWLVDHPRHHTAVIISDRLHSFVVAENVPALPPTHFRRVPVPVKEARRPPGCGQDTTRHNTEHLRHRNTLQGRT